MFDSAAFAREVVNLGVHGALAYVGLLSLSGSLRLVQIIIVQLSHALVNVNVEVHGESHEETEEDGCGSGFRFGIWASSASQVPGISANGSNHVAVRTTPYPTVRLATIQRRPRNPYLYQNS